MLPLLYPDRPTENTFAEPGEDQSYSAWLKTGETVLKGAALGPAGIGVALTAHIAAHPESNIFTVAERQTRLADNAFSEDASLEEAYQRRIDAVKAATGVMLENPQRGGYRLTERELRRLTADGPIDPGDYRRLAFEGRLRDLRNKNPDKTDALTFGNIDEEARAIAKGAEQDYEKARNQPGLDPVTSLATQFAGAMWGQRRDPIFVGSMFAGPTSAVGKTMAARIATSGVFQGLYNMGIAALEQPAVQAWRAEVGVKSGIVPAIENVGLAFLSGAIPGAALRGIHEGVTAPGRQAIERVLAGNPKPGDIDVALKAAGDAMAPQEAGAARVGESMDDLERVTRPPAPKNVPEALHEDLTGAAQRYGDDPLNSPSPAAVAAIDELTPETIRAAAIRSKQGQVFEGVTHGDAATNLFGAGHELSMAEAGDGFVTSTGRFVNRAEATEIALAAKQTYDPEFRRNRGPEAELHARDVRGMQEVADRVAAARPASLREAQMAASEALEDIGNRGNNVRLATELDAGKRLYTLEETFEAPPIRAGSKDPLDKVPLMRDDGTAVMVSPQQAARAGARETRFADIIRECK